MIPPSTTSSRRRALPSIAPDSADDDIRNQRVIDGATDAFLDRAVARPGALREPRREHLGRRGDQHRRHVRIARARGGHDGARDVADDGAARPGCRRRSTPGCRSLRPCAFHHSAKAPPAQRRVERLRPRACRVSSAAEAGRVTTRRGKHHARIVAAPRARTRDQRVLAGAARADHQHQPAGADPLGAGAQRSRRVCASQLMPPAARRARRRARRDVARRRGRG